MKLNKLFMSIFSLLAIESASFSTDMNTDFDQSLCTKVHPCYYEDGSLHFQENVDSNNGWNSYSITNFAVGTGLNFLIPLAIPIVHIAINRSLDYIAYKYKCFSGLRDGGGIIQTGHFQNISTDIREINNTLFLGRDGLEKISNSHVGIQVNLEKISGFHERELDLRERELNCQSEALKTYQEELEIHKEEISKCYQKLDNISNKKEIDLVSENKKFKKLIGDLSKFLKKQDEILAGTR